ncbi:MAG TPA: isopeptide-forming domain-containing fimbrial protein [Pyrinomonadaceae bacterium]|jgi:uncharacterized repeat protein (TIGR01451 family)
METSCTLRLRRVVLTLLGLALLLVCTSPGAEAQVLRTFTRRNPVTNVRGNIALTGNVLITCHAKNNNNCADVRDGLATGSNHEYTSEFVDTDGSNATNNSSSASLSLPAGSTVLWAGLYWGARSTTNTRSQIKFKPANSGIYSTLNATQLDSGAAPTNAYQGFVEVTAQVQTGGNGTYWAADITADNGQDGTGFYAGWSLVVVYQNNSLPLRNLTIFDGFASVSNGNNVTTTASGMLTPTTGSFNAYVGTVTYEGDQGISGDSFQVTNTTTNITTTISDGLNPSTNFFNSSITSVGTRISAKNPDYQNQLGFDVDTVSVANANVVLGNAATSVRLTFNSTQDLYFPGVLAFAVDVFRPQVEGNITKTVSDLNGGNVNPGDQLEYTITVSNTGNDGAINSVVTDSIPANSTYVAGSLQVTSGANTGVKTDGAGDDQAEYNGTSVIIRVGTGATSANGGTINPGESTTLKFKVQVKAGTAEGTIISNQAVDNYNAATLLDAFTSYSDGDMNTAGTQPTNVTVVVPPAPSVGLVKTCPSPANCTTADQWPGTDLTYNIAFTNSGGSPAKDLSIKDQIPANTDFKLGTVTTNLATTGLTVIVYYSKDGGTTWNYAPASGGGGAPAGYDRQVTHILWTFTGNLGSASPDNTGSVAFTVRIQ